MKAYRFKIDVRPAEFRDGYVAVSYGLAKDCRLASETIEATFPAALERLQQVSDATPGPHAAMLSMANASDRCPPGFKSAKRDVYKRSAQ